MVIRSWPALVPYFEKVRSLDKDCFGKAAWDQSTWRKMFEHRDLFVVLVEQDNLLEGYCLVSQVLDEAELLKIGVWYNLRRKGKGRELFQQAVTELATRNFRKLHLEVRSDNYPALQFYRRLGFKQTGFRANYYANPECDALLFSYPID